ncbi:terminase TerL endonuclease subunit [Mesomycoplasma molare]|uniref:Terminase large subunit n=1 Tax=Mesomycoplasma molare TaxID=171288 RepID=A0ABY5TTR9_9BACT|nr:terminase TerL endonuclease subunit [Mesomycoplasma molare]UWD34062.1 terminase large subunit [Mesomycoplasma molare]
MQIFNTPYWDKVKNFFKANTNWDEPTQYALKVFNGEILASKMVIYATARHLLFLYRSKTEETFPFIYQPETFEKLQKFASKIIIPEINRPFIFTDFRKFISGFVFGWTFKDDTDSLITNEVFDVEARKQWKSSYWAMIALATTRGLLKDGKSEVYFCGPHKDSSKIPYNIALGYIKKSKELKKMFERANSIRIVSTKQGEIKALPFDKAGIEGKNPSLVILTEYHLHKDDTMQESAKSSKNLSRKNQLIVYDTTKGSNRESACFYREQDYKHFLEQQIENPETIHKNYSIFLFCAELDEEDWEQWDNPDLWKKANPGLGITVSLDDLKDEHSKITSLQAQAEFKIKRLGIWVNTGFAYFDYSLIAESQEANKKWVEEYLSKNNIKELNALVGLDLSGINDTTALVLNFEIPKQDGSGTIYVFKAHNFIPENAIEKKELSDKARYREWHKQGHLSISKGDVIDYSMVVNKLREWKDNYKIEKLLYDKWRFFTIKEHLLKTNIFHESEIQEVKQGVYLNPAFQQFEVKLRNKEIYFLDNNGILINHTLNVEIKNTTSGSGTFFIRKVNENFRIDAFIAALNTISERHNVASKEVETTFDIITI